MGSKAILAAVHGEDAGRARSCWNSLTERVRVQTRQPPHTKGLEWWMAQCLILWKAILCWGICLFPPPWVVRFLGNRGSMTRARALLPACRARLVCHLSLSPLTASCLPGCRCSALTHTPIPLPPASAASPWPLFPFWGECLQSATSCSLQPPAELLSGTFACAPGVGNPREQNNCRAAGKLALPSDTLHLCPLPWGPHLVRSGVRITAPSSGEGTGVGGGRLGRGLPS